MSGFTPIILSALLGLCSVELFGGAWLAGLGVLAAVILRLMKRIGTRRCLARIHRNILWGALRLGVLALAFTVYLHRLGLGFEPGHMMGFFLGAVLGLGFFFAGVSGRVDEMLRTRRDD